MIVGTRVVIHVTGIKDAMPHTTILVKLKNIDAKLYYV